MKWLVLALRVGLGGLFVFAGIMKLADPVAFAIEIGNYRMGAGFAPYLAVILPYIEIALGAAVIFLPLDWRRGAALALAGLTAVFTVAVAQAVGRGINVDCGCFGGASGPVTWLTVGRDVALVAAAAAILALDRRRAVP
jgi:putative oxidoreductase